MHPQTGILSSIGNGFKNAFNEFVDIINIPSYTVSGILHSATTGSNVIDSVVKANKENISVSDELFKGTMYDINPQDPFAEKALKWATRTSVDILTDPLTYMTFGASGVSKLGIKIPNLEATAIGGAVEAKATELGLTGSKRAAYIDQEFTKALDAAEIKNIYDVKYLNEEGQKLVTERVKNLRDGTSEDFFKYVKDDLIKNGYAKNVEEAQTLVSKDFGSDAVQEALRNTLKRKSILTPENIKLDEALVKSTLEKSIKQSDVVDTLGKMLPTRPALAETLLEKGGVYFFKRSILSAQRMEAVS